MSQYSIILYISVDHLSDRTSAIIEFFIRPFLPLCICNVHRLVALMTLRSLQRNTVPDLSHIAWASFLSYRRNVSFFRVITRSSLKNLFLLSTDQWSLRVNIFWFQVRLATHHLSSPWSIQKAHGRLLCEHSLPISVLIGVTRLIDFL